MKRSTDYNEILERLGAFFNPEDLQAFPVVTTRDKKKGIPAIYVDSRAVRARLDQVCYWQDEFREGPDGGVVAGISILVDLPDVGLTWMTRWDGATNTGNPGDDMAVKGGLSNALRRAAVSWNVGQYLYDVGKAMNSMWIELSDYKKFVRPPIVPSQYLPEGVKDGKIYGGQVETKQPLSKAKPAAAVAKKTVAKPKKKVDISPNDMKRIMAAGKGKDAKSANTIVMKIQNDTLTVDDGIAELNKLPAKK